MQGNGRQGIKAAEEVITNNKRLMDLDTLVTGSFLENLDQAENYPQGSMYTEKYFLKVSR